MTFADRPVLEGTPQGMSDDDAALLSSALALLDDRYTPAVHEVAAALRLSDGRIVQGLHVEATAGRASICAESAALSQAVIAGATVVAVVSVLQRPSGTRHLIEPCGVCAELLGDYAATARVWVADGERFADAPVAQLLPYRRRRVARPAAEAIS